MGKLVYKDAADALKFIVKENFKEPDFVKNSSLTRDVKGHRVYSNPETADWWIDIEVNFRIKIVICWLCCCFILGFL